MMHDRITFRMLPLVACMLAAAGAASAAPSPSDDGNDKPGQTIKSSATPSKAPASESPHPRIESQRSKRAENYYKTVWGIEHLAVSETASGALLRFSYRVTDAARAGTLNDKTATPYLIDEKTGAVLQVPVMPKVGMLRQTAGAENGREYWMVFSNKRNFVKPRNRVDIVIGQFRANGLIVR